MWKLEAERPVPPPVADPRAPPGSRRDRFAVHLALTTLFSLAAALLFSKGTQVLMPGPLSSAHGAIEKCSACHSKSGSGKLSWIGGLVAGDPHADSKACLTCHKMPDAAFNAHGASSDVLKASTERLTRSAAGTPQPRSARAQSTAFPTHDIVARGLFCATCHQEHQGVGFDLGRISNEQCRACHVLKFDSFDGDHPKFENYPFERRTRIVYDHAAHFGKHYPEVVKKDPARRIPETCSSCHNSLDDRRIMSVAPFDQSCSSCHLGQIVGKERASGPKGVAFLAVPGLDLQTLTSKNASIGEWPDASEAALTPFMKVIIARTERGRALLAAVDPLSLQDLSNASDVQVEAVTELVWEIKTLLHALISGKASDVLGDIDIGGGAKPSAALLADLTASIPRDVLVSAQQEWLPNLGAEIAHRQASPVQARSSWSPVISEPGLAGAASPATLSGSDLTEPAPKAGWDANREEGKAPDSDAADARSDDGGETSTEAGTRPQAPEEPLELDARKADPSLDSEAAASDAIGKSKLDPPACIASVFGQCLVYKEQKKDTRDAKPDPGSESFSTGDLPGRMNAGAMDVWRLAQAEEAEGKSGPADGESSGANVERRWSLPSGTPRAIEAQRKDAGKAAGPRGADTTSPKADGGQGRLVPGEPPRGSEARSKDTGEAAVPKEAAGKGDAANPDPDGGRGTVVPDEQSPATAADQTDDLLFPTEDELREINARSKSAGKAAAPREAAGNADAASHADATAPTAAAAPATDAAATRPQTLAAPAIAIASDVDPESWADTGGWYRQDYAILYRPTGHKDNFITSWLLVTGPRAPKGDKSPAAAVFDDLTGKDARGSCTKCHSIDDLQGKGRVVNFSPLSVEHKKGRFTNFIHEPHFGVPDERGCFACHALEKGRPYLKSYEQGDPHNFATGFGAVKKDLCQSCHTSSMARQDCLLCHKYHVNEAVTPIMSTKLPAE